MNNKQRAEKVKKLLGLEETNYNDKNKYVSVGDVICDLRHYCDLNNIDWMDEQIKGDNYYAIEREDQQ